MPTSSNVHEVAQSRRRRNPAWSTSTMTPSPFPHARALLTSAPEGRTDFIEADLRQPPAILAEAARTLEFGRRSPSCSISILHLIQDTDDPYQLVRQLVSALAPDSYVLISHAASDIGNGQGWSAWPAA